MLEIKSCKHQDNIVQFEKKDWEIFVSWEWFNWWSSKKQVITDSILRDIDFLLKYWNDWDITLTVEKWKISIPLVIWCPNNSGDTYNDEWLYKLLSGLWLNEIKEKIISLI
jgi:hypothetical protein